MCLIYWPNGALFRSRKTRLHCSSAVTPHWKKSTLCYLATNALSHIRHGGWALLVLLLLASGLRAQSTGSNGGSNSFPATDRFAVMTQRLQALADSAAPGLNQRASLSVAGVSIQEFLGGWPKRIT